LHKPNFAWKNPFAGAESGYQSQLILLKNINPVYINNVRKSGNFAENCQDYFKNKHAKCSKI